MSNQVMYHTCLSRSFFVFKKIRYKVDWILHKPKYPEVFQIDEDDIEINFYFIPEACPVMTNLLGRDPTLEEPSHSCTQNEVMLVPSTDLITQTCRGKFKVDI